MTTPATLNSRLRVLIAKAYRAEKLYSSIRHTQGNDTPSVVELANDIRAREWQRAYGHLRGTLNDILLLGSPAAVSDQIHGLYRQFRRLSEESFRAVEQETTNLVETVKRHEFARCLKLSMELIRSKARAQAHKVIADELHAALQLNEKSTVVEDDQRGVEAEEELLQADVANLGFVSQTSSRPRGKKSNVVPLRRFRKRS